MTEQEQPTTADEETPTHESEQEREDGAPRRGRGGEHAPVPEGGHGPASEEEPPENGGDDE
jgi:hypothetical protein